MTIFKKVTFIMAIILFCTAVDSYAKKKKSKKSSKVEESTDPNKVLSAKNPFKSRYIEIFRNKLILAFYEGDAKTIKGAPIAEYFKHHVKEDKKTGTAGKYHKGTKILGRKYNKPDKKEKKRAVDKIKKKLAEHTKKKETQISLAIAELEKKLDKCQLQIENSTDDRLTKSREKKYDQVEAELKQVEAWIKEGEELIADLPEEEI